MRQLNVVALVLATAVACQSPSRPAERPAGPAGPADAGGASGPLVPTSAPAGLGQRREAPLPEPRQEVAAAADEELGLWVIGGYDGTGTSTPTVFRYRDGGWGREADLPLGLNHPAAAVLDDAVWVAGGDTGGPGGNAASRRVFTLPGPREKAPLNHARQALALVAAGEKLYAIGGKAGGKAVGPAEEYDPKTGKWTDLPALPEPRDHLAGFAWREMACVAGGRGPNTARVDCWDPAGRRWTTMPGLPVATSGAGAAVLGDRVVVAGGEDPAGGGMVDQLAVLDKGAWASGRMALPRHGIALASYGGRLWACGGGTRAGLDAVADCTSIG